MDLKQLEKINDYCWEAPGMRFYGSESLIAAMDEKFGNNFPMYRNFLD